ncbi:YcnI family protein [Lysinibacillus sp. NPDC093210]|uniref:YcnI family copper-binding membrane protein n=1 Tax=Lysinibacillus sp. NPDC093210 TaxID=3364133 RepID=UPI0037FE8B4B
MKNVFKKWTVGLMSSGLALMMFAGTASAHVSVKPEVSSPGAWETYTIKVPVEKAINTTKVTLKIPNGAEFESYQPVSGWDVTLDKDSSGKTKTVTWNATGAGIAEGQFQQFSFVAKNPEKETEAVWDAYQYYKDGTIVEWTGNESSDAPHSITKITTATNNVAPENTNHHQDNAKAEEKQKETENSSSQNTAVTLSIIALILAVLAVIRSFMRRK